LLLPGVGLEGAASAIVAMSDLIVVRLLRDAIRTADLSSAGHGGSPIPLKRNGPSEVRRVLGPAPRLKAHPEARIEPRPVIHPTPRFEPRVVVPAPVYSCDPSPCHRRNNPIEPIWRKPVWEIPTTPPAKVKVHLHRTDVAHKGSLIDLFI
jgi:hypothetical protein